STIPGWGYARSSGPCSMPGWIRALPHGFQLPSPAADFLAPINGSRASAFIIRLTRSLRVSPHDQRWQRRQFQSPAFVANFAQTSIEGLAAVRDVQKVLRPF